MAFEMEIQSLSEPSTSQPLTMEFWSEWSRLVSSSHWREGGGWIFKPSVLEALCWYQQSTKIWFWNFPGQKSLLWKTLEIPMSVCTTRRWHSAGWSSNTETLKSGVQTELGTVLSVSHPEDSVDTTIHTSPSHPGRRHHKGVHIHQ